MADFEDLSSAFEGPIPPAELAAARWGARAWERLARGADAALIEARLRECMALLGRLRRVMVPRGAETGVLERLVRNIAFYRYVAAKSAMGRCACALSR